MCPSGAVRDEYRQRRANAPFHTVFRRQPAGDDPAGQTLASADSDGCTGGRDDQHRSQHR